MSAPSPESLVPASLSEPRVYFEPQESALCAVHALNNLVQSPLFTPVDLSSAAADLYERERQLHAAAGVESAEYLSFLAADSAYASDEGNFSFESLTACLSSINCSLSPLTATPPQPSHAAFGLVANLESHWMTIRRVAVPPHLRSLLPAAHSTSSHVWLNLNSLLPRPAAVSDTFLSLFVAQLKADGYAVFEASSSNTELMEGALTSGDVAQCDASRWYSLRAILLSLHPAASQSSGGSDSRLQQSSRRSAAAVEDDSQGDDERAVQAAIRASMEDMSAHEPIVLDDDDEDAELRAAIALSMTTETPASHYK